MIDQTEKILAGIEPWKSYEWPQEHGDNNWYELGMNYNAAPYQSDTAIIVTSWKGHLKHLKASLTGYRLTGKYVICSYDPPFFAWPGSEKDIREVFPNSEMFVLPHAWVFKHITYDCAKRNGWFWDVRYAQGLIRQCPNFKYVWTVNGDCIWDKPEGISEIVEILGDGDLMSDASNFDGLVGGAIHTCSVIYKADAFHAIFDNMAEKMKVPVIGSRSPEGMLLEAVVECGLKEVKAPQQPRFPEWHECKGEEDFYHCYNEDCTWKEVLGFRNIPAELNTALIERLELPPKRYCDFYKNGLYFADWERTAYEYFMTGDRRWLLKAWLENEDSWWDRCYYPLEHFGKEPIIEPWAKEDL